MIFINYIIMCFIFGTTFLAIKIGVDAGAPPFMSAGLRFFFAGLILFLLMRLKGKTEWSLLFRKEMLFTGIGLTFGTFATLYWAEQFVSSGIAATLSATGPMMILLIQAAILREKLHPRSLIGCFIGLIGVMLLLSSNLTFEASIWWVLGSIGILMGEISYASGAIYSRRVISTFENASPIALNAAQMTYGGGLLIILSLFTEKTDVQFILSLEAISSLFYLMVFGSMIGHTLFYWLVAKTNPVFPATWLYISPIIAVILGAILYHEEISWLMGIGMVTIMTGTVLVNLDGLKELFSKWSDRVPKKVVAENKVS